MDVELTPKTAQKYYGSDGGSYYIWSSSDVPILSEAKVGAGKLVLAPRGLALPHYADAAKIGYVEQGALHFCCIPCIVLQLQDMWRLFQSILLLLWCRGILNTVAC